jgi:hypothetical protein
VTAGFYPLTGNPSGFLTAASLSGYATETFVTSQGYITSSALTPYLTKADNLGSLTNFATARSNLSLGTLDTPVFAGVTAQGSGSNVANLTPSALSITHSTFGNFTIQPSSGITFPDSTVQTTAFTVAQLSNYLAKASNLSDLASASTARTNLGLGSLAIVNDAPSDGSQYARKNGAWDVVSSTSPYITSVSSPLSVTSGNLTIDLSPYALLSGATFSGNVFAPTPSPGTNSTRIATTEWVKDLDYAPLNSPQFNGNPRGPTPSLSDNDTSLATTEFVKGQNYITSSALSGYATESWVTAELGDYLTTASAASTYAPIATPSFTGLATFDNPGNFAITVPNGASDYTSISAGVYSLVLSGTETVRISGLGIKYPDGVTQSVAYPGPSGFLLKADNLSGLASTSTARTNLGLGTMATATASDYSTTSVANGLYYPLSSNPAGYLTSAPVTSVAGRTGAVTLAVADVSGAAPLASPTFSGTPSLPTGTIGVTQTAGNNTTALATTAFVTAAVPAFATAAQVVTGTSTTTALAPGNAGFLKADPRLRSLAHISFTRVSGSGAVTAGSVGLGIREMYLGSLATGLAGFSYGWTGLVAANMSAADWNKVDFSKKIWMSGVAMCGATLGATNYIGDSNTRNRVTLGGYNSDTTSGDMSVKGIGWKKVGGTSPFFTLTVHNGTTLTDVATSVTQTAGKVINWVIYSDGTGNVTLYIDGVQAATTSAGPTGTSNTLQATYREQVEAVATPTVRAIMECSGGWIYLAD